MEPDVNKPVLLDGGLGTIAHGVIGEAYAVILKTEGAKEVRVNRCIVDDMGDKISHKRPDIVDIMRDGTKQIYEIKPGYRWGPTGSKRLYEPTLFLTPTPFRMIIIMPMMELLKLEKNNGSNERSSGSKE